MPAPEYPNDVAVSRAALGPNGAVDLLMKGLERARGRAFTSPVALSAWLRERGALRGYCDPELVPLVEHGFGGFTLETAFERARIDDYSFGITRAVGAIAETGTLVLDDARTSSRLAALAPWIHVAVVRRADIHRDLAAAIAALGTDPCTVWVTGPSKTADVEGILIEGVHGPGEEVALILD
jgi:L-lactate dehydrogenase complex protein LldG